MRCYCMMLLMLAFATGVRSQETGVRSQESGDGSQESGVGSQETAKVNQLSVGLDFMTHGEACGGGMPKTDAMDIEVED